MVFTRQLCFKKKLNYKEIGYHQRCEIFKLQTLHGRRCVSDLVYFHKVINNKIDCSYIVGEICISAPERRQRHQASKPTFAVKAKLGVRRDSYLPRVSKLANANCAIDIFNFTTVLSFKRRIRPFYF